MSLNEAERAALNAALDDEYKALATYEQVMQDFGPVRPFVNIVEAEARHIAALRVLFERYGVPLPESRWDGAVPRFASLAEACAAGIQAEIDNAALYDKLFQSTQKPDIIRVYQALRSASLERHLPAFRRCARRG